MREEKRYSVDLDKPELLEEGLKIIKARMQQDVVELEDYKLMYVLRAKGSKEV